MSDRLEKFYQGTSEVKDTTWHSDKIHTIFVWKISSSTDAVGDYVNIASQDDSLLLRPHKQLYTLFHIPFLFLSYIFYKCARHFEVGPQQYQPAFHLSLRYISKEQPEVMSTNVMKVVLQRDIRTSTRCILPPSIYTWMRSATPSLAQLQQISSC